MKQKRFEKVVESDMSLLVIGIACLIGSGVLFFQTLNDKIAGFVSGIIFMIGIVNLQLYIVTKKVYYREVKEE